MITVVNKTTHDFDVYCGRGSALGNPFPMHKEGDRDAVCDAYAIHLDKAIKAKTPEVISMLTYIKKLAIAGDVRLGCFCAPRRCHCDYIKQVVETVINKSGVLS